MYQKTGHPILFFTAHFSIYTSSFDLSNFESQILNKNPIDELTYFVYFCAS